MAAEDSSKESGAYRVTLAANKIHCDGWSQACLQPRPDAAPRKPRLDTALVWHVLNPFSVDLVWHNGGAGGYHLWIGFVSKKRAGAVVLSNSAGNIDDLGIHIVEPGFPAAGPPKARKEATFPPAVLETYPGEYQLSPARSIVVTREGAPLFVRATYRPMPSPRPTIGVVDRRDRGDTDRHPDDRQHEAERMLRGPGPVTSARTSSASALTGRALHFIAEESPGVRRGARLCRGPRL